MVRELMNKLQLKIEAEGNHAVVRQLTLTGVVWHACRLGSDGLYYSYLTSNSEQDVRHHVDVASAADVWDSSYFGF